MSRNKPRPLGSIYQNVNPMRQSMGESATLLYYRMYRQILTELAMNRFKWVGLPSGIDPRYLEMVLLQEPMVVFYQDPDNGQFFVSRATQHGQLNPYENPTRFTTVAMGNQPSRRLTARNAVPIYCNYQRVTDWHIVEVFSQQLATVSRTIDINLMQQRKPFVISAPEEKVLTVTNALKNVTDGEIAVLGNESLELESAIQAFNTGIHPQLVTNTQLAKEKIWNECMTLLGVNNVSHEKKERLVVDEANANNEQVDASRGGALSARREACEYINAKWGLSVSVDFNPGGPQNVPGLGMSPDKESEGGE